MITINSNKPHLSLALSYLTSVVSQTSTIILDIKDQECYPYMIEKNKINKWWRMQKVLTFVKVFKKVARETVY